MAMILGISQSTLGSKEFTFGFFQVLPNHMLHRFSAWHSQLYFPLVRIFCVRWCWHAVGTSKRIPF